MEESKSREKNLVQAEGEPEAGSGLSEEIAQEDFEQVEEKLWEEYLQEDESDSGMTPERSLIKMRMEQSMTVLLTFVITNIFYVIILFLAWYNYIMVSLAEDILNLLHMLEHMQLRWRD